MRYHHHIVVLTGLLVAAATASAQTWQAPWEADPSDPQWAGGVTTFQCFDFNQELFTPIVSDNDFGTAFVEPLGASPEEIPGPGDQGVPINTWHVDQTGGGLTFGVPNYDFENPRKVIFLEWVSDKFVLQDGTGITTDPGGQVLPGPHPAVNLGGGGWYRYNSLVVIEPNPAFETVTLAFPESANIAEVYIHTICVPEPTSLSLLLLAGLPLLRRR